MKITKENFKKIVREVMTEELEYQTFFKKALEKTGKSIPDMSDEEKKEFFNKIDSAWQGKGEKKNEGNAFGAAVSDAKEKGEDEFKVGGEKFQVESVVNEIGDPTINDLAYFLLGAGGIGAAGFGLTKLIDRLKSGKGGSLGKKLATSLEKAAIGGKGARLAGQSSGRYESVSVNEEATTSSAPGQWVAFLSMTRGKKLLKTFDTARGAKQFLSKNVDKLLSGSNVESVGLMTKKQWDTTESKYAIEGVVNEQLVPVDKKAVDAFFNKKPFVGKNLNSDGKVLKTVGVGSQEMFIYTPKGVKMVGKVTGQYAQSLVQYVMKNHKSDLVESVNEISISQLAAKDVEHLDTHVGGKSEKEVLKFIDNVYNFYPKNFRKFMADKFIEYQKGNINKKYLTGVFRIMHQQIR